MEGIKRVNDCLETRFLHVKGRIPNGVKRHRETSQGYALMQIRLMTIIIRRLYIFSILLIFTCATSFQEITNVYAYDVGAVEELGTYLKLLLIDTAKNDNNYVAHIASIYISDELNPLQYKYNNGIVTFMFTQELRWENVFEAEIPSSILPKQMKTKQYYQEKLNIQNMNNGKITVFQDAQAVSLEFADNMLTKIKLHTNCC